MKKQSVIFRKALPNDIAELKRIARDVVRHNYSPFLGADAAAAFIESGMSDEEIEAGIDSCILLEKAGDIAAFVIIKEDLLHLIMVDVPFQHAGYGGALLAYAQAEMFSRYRRIYLQSFLENSGAASFYGKHGWRATGRADVPGMDVTMVRYEKLRE